MALITDINDPTGMFSKSGRVSSEMFTMLQLKEEILYNKKKYYNTKFSSFEMIEEDVLIY